jgi:hypothetical protein
MILYHGTSSEHLEAIRKTGLQPRRITKRRSNWKGSIESKRDFVYLTDAYPVYYAMNPALGERGKQPDILIFKLEVDESQLYPDEDFIAWEMARNDEGLSVRDLIAEIDPADFQHHWRESLERNGIACTRSVSVEKILEHKIIPANYHRLLYSIGGDAMPTPLNYLVMGDHYRRCIETLFEHSEEAALNMAASYWSLGKAS